MRDGSSSNGGEATDGVRQKSGHIVRIGTALGTFVVEIINDFGPIADPLTADIERSVIACLRAHRKLGDELATVDIQRGELDFETHQL
ncbi:MAG TPA: hypothetical protein VH475_25140 [Tepidisphaeraceae bacterium]|jgi:hypothetical protein